MFGGVWANQSVRRSVAYSRHGLVEAQEELAAVRREPLLASEEAGREIPQAPSFTSAI